MSQNSLWQTNKQNNDFSELCNALYERELRLLAKVEMISIETIQGRLKSLSHYVNRTANLMVRVNELGYSPLTLDTQNATWSAKQASKLSILEQNKSDVFLWYLTLINKPNDALLGLAVPIVKEDHIILDCIDRIDNEKKRIRTNTSGWFSLTEVNNDLPVRLLKPNKKVLLAACAGHRWQDRVKATKLRPIIPSLRELLISGTIDWRNFKRPLAL